ncbi:PD-(D/E)XK nuclease family protein [Candidatus Woesearchaeota archaeon]|nr:PD-(D/E)XK nuclease family protein [Candidatus Woesearchaeota archaeon]
MVIKQTSLNHKGGFYFYRIHSEKLNHLCNGFGKLNDFLFNMFENCPDEYFNSGPRSSMLRFKLDFDTKVVQGHEICDLASHGLLQNKDRYNSNHIKVQSFLIENDSKTIAVEVPIWMYNNEVDYYTDLFKTIQPLTGHIDILRMENDKIWIWDYKPNSHNEEFASTQIYFYALMLSKRTGIDIEKFRCGYFDENYAYMFKPSNNILLKNKRIKEFL